jgi:transposase
VVERARIVLASATGLSGEAICAQVGVSRPTVTLWLDRYEAGGRAALETDRPRSGRPKRVSPEREAAIVKKTLEEAPPDGGTHWSTRLMARATGLHQSTISRLWRAHGLKPHRLDYFKISTDPEFVAKLRDVVGLYLDPPKRAVVFSVDEKSQLPPPKAVAWGVPLGLAFPLVPE